MIFYTKDMMFSAYLTTFRGAELIEVVATDSENALDFKLQLPEYASVEDLGTFWRESPVAAQFRKFGKGISVMKSGVSGYYRNKSKI